MRLSRKRWWCLFGCFQSAAGDQGSLSDVTTIDSVEEQGLVQNCTHRAEKLIRKRTSGSVKKFDPSHCSSECNVNRNTDPASWDNDIDRAYLNSSPKNIRDCKNRGSSQLTSSKEVIRIEKVSYKPALLCTEQRRAYSKLEQTQPIDYPYKMVEQIIRNPYDQYRSPKGTLFEKKQSDLSGSHAKVSSPSRYTGNQREEEISSVTKSKRESFQGQESVEFHPQSTLLDQFWDSPNLGLE